VSPEGYFDVGAQTAVFRPGRTFVGFQEDSVRMDSHCVFPVLRRSACLCACMRHWEPDGIIGIEGASMVQVGDVLVVVVQQTSEASVWGSGLYPCRRSMQGCSLYHVHG